MHFQRAFISGIHTLAYFIFCDQAQAIFDHHHSTTGTEYSSPTRKRSSEKSVSFDLNRGESPFDIAVVPEEDEEELEEGKEGEEDQDAVDTPLVKLDDTPTSETPPSPKSNGANGSPGAATSPSKKKSKEFTNMHLQP